MSVSGEMWERGKTWVVSTSGRSRHRVNGGKTGRRRLEGGQRRIGRG